MSGNLFDKYGAIYEEDIRVIEDALSDLILKQGKKNIRVLEIGCHEGATARGIKNFIEANGATLEYWGIDPGLISKVGPPFPGAHFVAGFAEYMFDAVPNDFDFIFVDGNHSRNSVILDTYNYKDKVNKMGFMLYHDAGPGMQGQDHQYSGPVTPPFHVAVLEGLKMISWPHFGWVQRAYDYPRDHNRCGTISFQRVVVATAVDQIVYPTP